jgi:hypothetical protein
MPPRCALHTARAPERAAARGHLTEAVASGKSATLRTCELAVAPQRAANQGRGQNICIVVLERKIGTQGSRDKGGRVGTVRNPAVQMPGTRLHGSETKAQRSTELTCGRRRVGPCQKSRTACIVVPVPTSPQQGSRRADSPVLAQPRSVVPEGIPAPPGQPWGTAGRPRRPPQRRRRRPRPRRLRCRATSGQAQRHLEGHLRTRPRPARRARWMARCPRTIPPPGPR